MTEHPLDLAPGQSVVHPRHGVATVEGYEERDLGGETLRYVRLRREENLLTVMVPVREFEDKGLREVVADADVDDVLDVLGDDPIRSGGSWRKRHSRNERRLQSGDIEQLAVAVRELEARDATDGLPPSDKRLRDQARERLVNELAASLDEDPDRVDELIEESLDLPDASG